MKIALFIPPLTQINTPYPATAYLKGFLQQTKYKDVFQADLGLELILKIFTKSTLSQLFDEAARQANCSPNTQVILNQRRKYELCVDAVIAFLQNKNPTLAHKICSGDYLPEASRFEALQEEVEMLFGSVGISDKAKMLCTLFLEDIGDLIIECICPYFGFSRYAEDIARSATSFDPIHQQLTAPNNSLDALLWEVFEKHIIREKPDVVCFTVPFPGNLYGALKCGQYLKLNYPHIKIMMGGGFPNTELRSLTEPRVFDFTDFITLDDGEKPLLNILEYLENKREIQQLKRTFIRQNNQVVYVNACKEADIAHRHSATPDYSGLLLNQYISILEMANPMHRLWSDGRWNKLTVAHGCYWKKCSFCDISLDYIGRYEPTSAKKLADKMEEIIAQTGTNGFHFVDEAAPPLSLRDLAIELIDRQLDVSWWTNIRFEKTFSADLCKLLAASGCIAVTGGLEVASDRLLTMMEKGVTVQQVSQVANHFTQAGIMVHAYLMYGFPTQSAQETIDSLEVVRQLFENGVLQSGFWHRFSMTAHSPVGLNPALYQVVKVGPEDGTFANNDLIHEDPKGCNHDLFAEGLRKSLYNFMLDNCLDWSVNQWFDFEVPKTTLSPQLIQSYLEDYEEDDSLKLKYRLIWLGNMPHFLPQNKNVKVNFDTPIGLIHTKTDAKTAEYLHNYLKNNHLLSKTLITFADFLQEYTAHTEHPQELLLGSDTWAALRQNGLLLIRF